MAEPCGDCIDRTDRARAEAILVECDLKRLYVVQGSERDSLGSRLREMLEYLSRFDSLADPITDLDTFNFQVGKHIEKMKGTREMLKATELAKKRSREYEKWSQGTGKLCDHKGPAVMLMPRTQQ